MTPPRTWPALRLTLGQALSDGDRDALLVDVDGLGVIGLDEDDTGVTLYFQSADDRSEAQAALATSPWAVSAPVEALDVPDDGWAARSQADLPAIMVGDIIVSPPWDVVRARTMATAASDTERVTLIEIEPSTGFGTGHHQSTRLCLQALQQLDVRGLDVLDVGTGSGVLAIAAVRRGALRATGIDPDQDAIDAARDSVTRNDAADVVSLRTVGLDATDLSPAPVVFANLTGVLLRREAAAIQRLIAPGGCAILSGFTDDEAPWVQQAFSECRLEARFDEESWVAFILRRLR